MANPGLIKCYLAGGTVGPRRIVKIGAADMEVVEAAAATDNLYGVSLSPVSRAAGERIDVVLSGTVDVELGGTVARGARVTSDSQGRAVTAAPASGANAGVIGTVITGGVVGDQVTLRLAPGVMQGV